jgi:Domain of unknown function (DUF4331)
MSHHLDSELARQDPRLDISDVYLFRGTSGTVFVMNVEPLSGRRGFHPEGLYEFKVDLDRDSIEDVTFRFTFEEADAEGAQQWTLRRLDGAEARDRAATGTVLLTGVTGEIREAGDRTIRTWAGPAADPFYIEGSVITAVRTAIAEGKPVMLDEPVPATNIFQGTDVGAIVLEVSDGVLAADTIGFWGVTALATDAGGWRQINRCGQPLINTLFDLEDADQGRDFNATQPCEDRAHYGPQVVRDTAAVVAAMATSDDPKSHAERLRDTLFPDVLWYEIGTDAHFGTKRRNGRGLREPTPEVMIELVLGTGIPLGLDAASAVPAPRADFPYLAAPFAEPTHRA